MKHALSALLGSLVSTIAVVLAGHTPALLVGLGFVTALLLYTWILRLLGVERYARWFYAGVTAGDPLRVKISGEVNPLNIPAATRRQFSNRTGKSETIRRAALTNTQIDRRTRPVGRALSDEQLERRYERLSAKRKREMALDLWAAHLESAPKAEREYTELPNDAELFGEVA